MSRNLSVDFKQAFEQRQASAPLAKLAFLSLAFFIFSLVLINLSWFSSIVKACLPGTYCQLTMTKTNTGFDPIKPGENLVYRLAIKNQGTGDCSGTGVLLKDVFDQNTVYASTSVPYQNKTATYLQWNFETIKPGETKQLDLTMQVKNETSCGSKLTNKLKNYSTELGWSDFITEQTSVVCPPVCGNGVKETGEECDDGNTVSGDGCSASCTIEASHLIVKKVVVNDNGGTKAAKDFSFSVNHGANAAFTDSGENDLAVEPGKYTITEPSLAGYTTSYDNCTDLNLLAGASTTCTITNNDIQPKLIVIKHIINDNQGTSTATDFTINVIGSSTSPANFAGVEAPGTEVSLNAGTYSVTENGPSGYTMTTSADCLGTIAVGETKTCTITNDDNATPPVPAHLTVIKQVINDNNGSKIPADFIINITGSGVSSTTFAGNVQGTTVTLLPGSYNVDEVTLAGYQKTLSQNCSGTIAAGETKTCTIINDDIAPWLRLIKQVINGDLGQATTSDWTLTATGNQSPTPTVLTGSSSVISDVTFTAGTYTLLESTGPTNYTASNWQCTGDVLNQANQITLAVGQSATCTITNTFTPVAITATLTVIKIINGGTATTSDFTLTVGSTTVLSGIAQNFTAGNYLITEQGPANYTASFSQDCPNGNITLVAGDIKTCTITNSFSQPAVCGDHSCNGSETCSSCPGDCGSCGGGGGTTETPVPFGFGPPPAVILPPAIIPPVAATPTPPPVILGQVGAPQLVINKDISYQPGINYYNPGDNHVPYTIVIANNGNLTAYNLVLVDTLPAGFSYSDNDLAEKRWELGDLKAGDIIKVDYQVDILKSVKAGSYDNLATVMADNHSPIKASASITIKQVKVLGGVLAPTGLSKRNLLSLLALVVLLLLISLTVNRRYVKPIEFINLKINFLTKYFSK